MENYDDDNVRWVMGIPFKVRGSAAATATAEPKFKVGDRERVVKDGRQYKGSYHGAAVGSVCVVTDAIEGGYVRDDGWYFNHDEVELIPTFTVGARVRLTCNAAGFMRGDEGVVERVTDYVLVKMDARGVFRGFAFDELEAADCAGRNGQREANGQQAKFKAGDVVRSKRFKGSGYAIKCVKTHYDGGMKYDGPLAYDYTNNEGWDREEDIELVTAADCPQDNVQSTQPACPPSPQPAIVALVKNGQPRPADRPYVHASVEAATTEAERLARNNPGQEFAVYQRVCARVCEAETTYSMKEVA